MGVALLGHQLFGIAGGHAGLLGEAASAGAHQQHVGALQHLAGELDRVGNALDRGDRASLELAAFHDAGVQLDLAVAITKTPTDIPPELARRLREHFDEAQLVELAAAIAWENYRARFNRVFGVRPAGFSEGAFCVLPERSNVQVAQ